MSISGFGVLTSCQILAAAQEFGTPLYLYDESVILEKCKELKAMPHAYGLQVNFAMKANSSRAILQLIASLGFGLDCSSLNECYRAHFAGIPYSRMMLTTQESYGDGRRSLLEQMIQEGLQYNVCSLYQLELIADFASRKNISLSIRIHPGQGSGESSTRNTGDKYACFGIHLCDIPKAQKIAAEKSLFFKTVHIHIGSGGSPEKWRENIDRELSFVEQFFPDVSVVNFGGGFREARMPDETAVNIQKMGSYAKERFEAFYNRTGRKLKMEIEPGTYIVANAGYLITSVIDEKWTGPEGFEFVILDGGMEANTRPLLYGSRHPLYVIDQNGQLLSAEQDLSGFDPERDARVVVGKNCETGDSQSLDALGNIVPRVMADPEIGDYVAIGGCGAYCSAMSLCNYNSHFQAAEVLLRPDGSLRLIRKRQSIEQMVQNELPLT